MTSLSATKYLTLGLFPYAWILGILAMIPAVWDAARQEFFKKIESNNRRRVVTGLFCGLGMALILEALHHGI